MHVQAYGARVYREDETTLVHWFRLFDGREMVSADFGDPLPLGSRIAGNAWVDAFGIAEPVVRWSSKLLNLFSFALVYQLGAHILDRRAGLYAIALLGLYGFAANDMSEFRPYPALVAIASALHLVYLRWLHKPTGRLMVAYVCLGIMAVYTHLYALTVFPAHALVLLAFRRFNRVFLKHTNAAWCFIGLAFAPWTLPMLQSMLLTFGDGYYSFSIAEFVQKVAFEPSLIFGFLLLLYIVAWQQAWQKRAPSAAWHRAAYSRLAYPALLPLGVYAFALAVDSFWSLMNPRGFMSVVSLVALILAIGLCQLPTKAGFILLFLLYLQAPQNIALQTSNGPYREIVAEMSKSNEHDSIVVTEFNWAWRWLLGAAYYLQDFRPDQISKQRQFHLVEEYDSAHPPSYPDELAKFSTRFDGERFQSALPQHQQLWRLREGGGNELGAALEAWLEQHYAYIRTVRWDEGYMTSYSLSEYIRAPENDGPILEAGENLRLYAWTMRDSHKASPCQVVTVESWWQLEEADSTPYTISIILADSDGTSQLAIADSVPANEFTSDWKPDAYYRDRSALAIPCNIKSGRYDLLLAGKESITGAPLLLAHPGGDPIGREVYLTTLVVAED